MKTFFIIMCTFSLIYAKSTTAISNQFSIGSDDVLTNTDLKHNKFSNVINIIRKNNGILLELNGSEPIYSLSLVSINGRILKTYITKGVKSIFLNECNSLPKGCYIVEVNGRFSQTLVLSGMESFK